MISTPTVYPSGGDLATESSPIEPVAPGLFSAIILCPGVSLNFVAITRANRSVLAPGGNGTTRRIGLDG